VDTYFYKNFKLSGLNYQFFVRIYNLLDSFNEVDVFSDTGRAGYSLAPVYTGGLRPQGINTLNQYYIRPDFYSSPREVQIGITLEF
jgi:hypothetical protein